MAQGFKMLYRTIFLFFKALVLILWSFLFYINCTPLLSLDKNNFSSLSYEELEAKARDNISNNPRKRGGSGGGSGGGSSGSYSGGGGQPILKTFCPDCENLITCLKDATATTENLLKGWYYFCPARSDLCLEFFQWASFQLTENKYREWIKHTRSRDQIPAVGTATDLTTPGYAQSIAYYGALYQCYTPKYQEQTTRDTACETDNAGDQTAIDSCKLSSKKTFFDEMYQCWAEEYEHKKSFFCD